MIGVAAGGYKYDHSLVSKEVFAGSLLFAMGLQNALVSMVSGSVVRITHLTGTFTNPGIELAHVIQKERNRPNSFKVEDKTAGNYYLFLYDRCPDGSFPVLFLCLLCPFFTGCYPLLYIII